MPRTLTECQLIERSIHKKYRKALWTPFAGAVKRYGLVLEGDRIAACVSGGRDSMLMAKLLQLLERCSDAPFSMTCLAVDPGWPAEERRRLEETAARLGLPLQILPAERPCARVRARQLFLRARELGCNKIALGQHFDDVVETALRALLYGAQLRGTLPKARSDRFPGMELIRPLYCVRRDTIAAWVRYNGLSFPGEEELDPARAEVRRLLARLKADNPDVEKSVFNALHAAWPDTFPGWSARGAAHAFLDDYDARTGASF